jgi:hypothetical protein
MTFDIHPNMPEEFKKSIFIGHPTIEMQEGLLCPMVGGKWLKAIFVKGAHLRLMRPGRINVVFDGPSESDDLRSAERLGYIQMSEIEHGQNAPHGLWFINGKWATLRSGEIMVAVDIESDADAFFGPPSNMGFNWGVSLPEHLVYKNGKTI